MKSYLHKFVISGLCLISSIGMAGNIPEGYPVNRYASLWGHSPFTIASVQQEVVPAGFATKLALVGIAKIGLEDLVILINKDSQERINVSPEPNAQGIKLISVEPNQDPLKASVTIQKGTEVAKVKYDQTLLSTVAAPPGNPANVQAQQPVPANQGQATMPSSGANPAVVRVRRTLPIPTPYPMQPASSVPPANIPRPPP